jgi:hypothetical protein
MKKLGNNQQKFKHILSLAINRPIDQYLTLKFSRSQLLIALDQRGEWVNAKNILKGPFFSGLSKISWLFNAASIYLLERVIFLWEESSF